LIFTKTKVKLMDLNQQRAEAEILGGKVADKSKGKGEKTTKPEKNSKNKNDMGTIPGMKVN
jgi:hypothetical protein